jgi:hypothetical protein
VAFRRAYSALSDDLPRTFTSGNNYVLDARAEFSEYVDPEIRGGRGDLRSVRGEFGADRGELGGGGRPGRGWASFCQRD